MERIASVCDKMPDIETGLVNKFYRRKQKRRHELKDSNAIGGLNRGQLTITLSRLKDVAREAGLIDHGWMDYLDQTLTYDENKSLLMEKGGIDGKDSPFKKDRKRQSSIESKKEEHFHEKQHHLRERALSEKWPKYSDIWEIVDNPNPPDVASNKRQSIGSDSMIKSRPAHEVQFGQVVKEKDPSGSKVFDGSDWDFSDSTSSGSDEETNESDKQENYTKVSELQIGDEYGYASVRLPKELVLLLERMKREYELESRRAAIDKILHDFPEAFTNPDGLILPEWEETLRKSDYYDIPDGDKPWRDDE